MAEYEVHIATINDIEEKHEYKAKFAIIEDKDPRNAATSHYSSGI